MRRSLIRLDRQDRMILELLVLCLPYNHFVTFPVKNIVTLEWETSVQSMDYSRFVKNVPIRTIELPVNINSFISSICFDHCVVGTISYMTDTI